LHIPKKNARSIEVGSLQPRAVAKHLNLGAPQTTNQHTLSLGLTTTKRMRKDSNRQIATRRNSSQNYVGEYGGDRLCLRSTGNMVRSQLQHETSGNKYSTRRVTAAKHWSPHTSWGLEPLIALHLQLRPGGPLTHQPCIWPSQALVRSRANDPSGWPLR